MNTTTKLNLEKAKSIAREYLTRSRAYASLSSDEKGKVVCGGTIEGDVAKCSFYIPGTRPELGKVVLVLSINRTDGSMKEIHASEF